MSFGSRRTCSTNGRMAIFAELGMPLFTGNPRRRVLGKWAPGVNDSRKPVSGIGGILGNTATKRRRSFDRLLGLRIRLA